MLYCVIWLYWNAVLDGPEHMFCEKPDLGEELELINQRSVRSWSSFIGLSDPSRSKVSGGVRAAVSAWKAPGSSEDKELDLLSQQALHTKAWERRGWDKSLYLSHRGDGRGSRSCWTSLMRLSGSPLRLLYSLLLMRLSAAPDHPGVCPNHLNLNLWVDAQSTCERECQTDQVNTSLFLITETTSTQLHVLWETSRRLSVTCVCYWFLWLSAVFSAS